MGNIDLDKIYEAALLVEPKDFTAGNEKFESFVKIANANSVCRMIDEIKQLIQKLKAAEAENFELRQQLTATDISWQNAEQIIRDAREQKPYYHLNDGVGFIPLYKNPVPAMPAPKQGYNTDSDEVFGVELSVYGAPPQAAAIPEGYVLAPADPTSTMLDAGVAMALQVSVHGEGGWSKYLTGLYKQMLSAAPKPEGG
jgi:hypothetical protein